MPLRPLTKVRYAQAALRRAEEAVTEARLQLADAIVTAREAGKTWGEIGVELGLTRQRVFALVKWAEEQRKGGK